MSLTETITAQTALATKLRIAGICMEFRREAETISVLDDLNLEV